MARTAILRDGIVDNVIAGDPATAEALGLTSGGAQAIDVTGLHVGPGWALVDGQWQAPAPAPAPEPAQPTAIEQYIAALRAIAASDQTRDDRLDQILTVLATGPT